MDASPGPLDLSARLSKSCFFTRPEQTALNFPKLCFLRDDFIRFETLSFKILILLMNGNYWFKTRRCSRNSGKGLGFEQGNKNVVLQTTATFWK